MSAALITFKHLFHGMPSEHCTLYTCRHMRDILKRRCFFKTFNFFFCSCSLDHIWLKLKVEDGVIVDGSFVGEGCAVSQASADMMLDLIIGQKVEDAEKLADNFLKMIKGTATEEEIESLEEASTITPSSTLSFSQI